MLARLIFTQRGERNIARKTLVTIWVGLCLVMAGPAVVHADRARSVRGELATWRGLLQEATRAELELGGPFIDLGSADQHKYTRGGYGTGWGSARRDDGATYAAIDGRAARLVTLLREPPRELVLRARSAARRQKLTVRLGDARGKTAAVGRDWSLVRIPIAATVTGHTELSLSLARAGLEVDWLWLRTADAPELPGVLPRVGPLRLGNRTRRALVAPTARAYSFYMHVPRGASLVFDYGSDRQVQFVVRAQTDDGETHELARLAARPDRWREHRIGLSRFAGRAVRLELATEGPIGRTGWGEPEIMVPPAVAQRARRELVPAKNAIVIVLDTTRADAFATVDPGASVDTPAYDSLAVRATRFPNAYNNENWTKPSSATILSGLYPDTHGARRAKDELSHEVELVSEHMQRHDVTTVGIVANANISDVFGFEQGWDYFDNQSRTGRGNGSDVYGDAIEWLEQHHADGRFFMYLQSVDAHTTYQAPRALVERYYDRRYRGKIGRSFDADEQRRISKGKLKVGDDDVAWIRALYAAEVSYQDFWLGQLLDKLGELGRLEDTVVVITNDHGEELGEHGHWGHGWTLYEEQVRAPLLVHYPRSFPEGEAVDEVVEHVDLAPTLAEAMGLPALKGADGMSLVSLLTGRAPRQRPFYALLSSRTRERSVRVGRYKLAVGRDGGWTALRDLARDPNEQADLRESHVVAGRLCEVYLGEAMATSDKPRRLREAAPRRKFRAGKAKIDAATRKQLEALGYLGGDAGE